MENHNYLLGSIGLPARSSITTMFLTQGMSPYMLKPSKNNPWYLWPLRHWFHFWQLRTTIWTFTVTLEKRVTGTAFAILAMFLISFNRDTVNLLIENMSPHFKKLITVCTISWHAANMEEPTTSLFVNRRQYYLTHRNDDVLSRLLSIGVGVALDWALLPVDNLAKKMSGQNGQKTLHEE